MLGRSIEDEMARITERGGRHAAAAWTSIAVHTSKPDEQLHTRQQVRRAYELQLDLTARTITRPCCWWHWCRQNLFDTEMLTSTSVCVCVIRSSQCLVACCLSTQRES